MPDNHTPTTDEQGKTLIENKLNELYGSHDFLGHVINTIPDLVWMKDTNGIYLLGNAALEKFFGVTQKGFLGKSDFDFMDEADANLCKQSDETAIKSDNISFSEEKVLNSDNKEVILEIRKIAVRDVSGELLGIMGIATDITERRLAEEVTAKSEQEFRTLTENLPDNIVRYNLDCRVTYVSPAIERIGGKDAVAMLMGKTPMESHFILNDEQAKMYQHCLEQTIATGEINEMELTTTPVHAGEVQIHHIRFVPEHLPSGEICGAMAIGRDITEQKKIEGVLQHKQSMLTEAQRLAVLGSWDWDVIKNKVEWSEMAYEIYTPDKHPADPNFEDFTSSLHEDDKERVIAAVVSAFEHDTPFDLDHRVVSKSKGVRTVHAHGKVFRDKDGKPIRMIGTVHDITERKASEKMLRMLSDSLNVTSESVFIVDLDSAQMIYVNDTAARTLEYSREELLSGMSVFDLDPDFDHDKWKAHMLDIKNHGAVTIETKHRTKSGRVYPVEVTAHYFEYDGKVYNLAVTRDITERIEKELLLRKKEYEYRTLASNLPGTLVRYDKECRFVFVNRVFENSLGIVLEVIKGK